MRIISSITIFSILILLLSCKKDDVSRGYPRLQTLEITNITEVGATFNVEFSSDSSYTILQYGFVWATNDEPSLNSKSEMISFTEPLLKNDFSANITSTLYKGVRYYVKPYIITNNYTVYGKAVTFVSAGTNAPLVVYDIDGNEYPVISIGGKVWMGKNLRTTRYLNGDPIPTGLSSEQWRHTITGAYAIYPFVNVSGITSNEEMLNAYGALYNYLTISDPRGLCPEGWRVAKLNDWTEMSNFLIENYSEINVDNVGNYLKSCRQVGSPLGGICSTLDHPRWNFSYTQYGNEIFNFAALPGGYRDVNGSYYRIGDYGKWWIYPLAGIGLSFNSGSIDKTNRIEYDGLWLSNPISQFGLSVRCIKE